MRRAPSVCRQYLVTSPPTLCADPLHAPVAVVPLPLKPMGAMLKVSAVELQRTADARPMLQVWLDEL